MQRPAHPPANRDRFPFSDGHTLPRGAHHLFSSLAKSPSAGHPARLHRPLHCGNVDNAGTNCRYRRGYTFYLHRPDRSYLSARIPASSLTLENNLSTSPARGRPPQPLHELALDLQGAESRKNRNAAGKRRSWVAWRPASQESMASLSCRRIGLRHPLRVRPLPQQKSLRQIQVESTDPCWPRQPLGSGAPGSELPRFTIADNTVSASPTTCAILLWIQQPPTPAASSAQAPGSRSIRLLQRRRHTRRFCRRCQSETLSRCSIPMTRMEQANSCA